MKNSSLRTIVTAQILFITTFYDKETSRFHIRSQVDLEGVEPSSERGNHKLSTCLSLTVFFVQRQDQSHQPMPYLLLFHNMSGASRCYSRFCCTAVPVSLRKATSERCLVSASWQKLSDSTVLQIKQRERICFRQIIFESSDYSASPQRTACLLTISTRRQNRSSPMIRTQR